ncbi:hypothetical protein Q8F55_004904 [Vanrija albida]|uniref:Zn(2)-C6 fungal-type domain-containing protein n=1 Tax=Vanrija albida TaxID=181172 RepID=A0ABR3Q042_9TREE
MAITACVACRELKAKCIRANEGDKSCTRCTKLGTECQVIPRKLGRKLGSKNRPKNGPDDTAGPSAKSTHVSAHASSSGSPERKRRRTGSTPPLTPPHGEKVHPPADPTASSFGGMLNVLACVANQEPGSVQVCCGTGLVMIAPAIPTTTPKCLDRAAFLAEFSGSAASIDESHPYAGLAVLEEGLNEICRPGSPTHEVPGEDVVHQPIDQPRYDNWPEYDVVNGGFVTIAQAEDLLEVYWAKCNPVIRVLDPEIHTIAYMREKSALLTTACLAVAAQTLPTNESTLNLVHKLDRHAHHLIGQVSRHGFQSMEIVQAILIMITYLCGLKQHLTWALLSKAIGIAVELRLDVTPTPQWQVDEFVSRYHNASMERMKRNLQRTWMLLIDWDRATAFIRGRRPILHDHLCGSMPWLTEWCSQPVQLQRRILYRLASKEAFDFEDPEQQRIVHDMRCLRFVLLMTPYEHSLYTKGISGMVREQVLAAAIEVCKGAIPLLAGNEPTSGVNSVTCYRLYVISYTAFCTLRIIDASPMWGAIENLSSDIDLFHLSILGALAKRFLTLRAHMNVGTLSTALGRRLMNATRKLATTRFFGEEGHGAPGVGSTRTEDKIRAVEGGSAAVPETAGDAPPPGYNGPIFGDNGLMAMMDPQEVAFSFDFTHIGELFPFTEETFANYM